jgi:hypothetical protein
MDARNTIGEILRNATGKRASGRELLVSEKKSILDPAAASTLKEQWKSAGRDNAYVVMRLTEEDGTNVHYVTGWDGKDTFVCLTESGLSYVGYRKLEKLNHDPEWNSKTRLIEVRAPLLRENMERADVDMLIDRIKKTLVKSSKKRRKGRLRNMEKFFAAAVIESDTQSEKSEKSGPKSGTEFVKVDEKDERTPDEEPPGRNEAVCWDATDKAGAVLRRPLNHPMMKVEDGDPQLDKREHVRVDKEGKGGSVGATPGGNKTDPQMSLRQLVTMNRESKAALESIRSESGDPQLNKRENVIMNKESGGGVGPTPGGNKTDPQMKLRELVRMDRETSGGTVRSEADGTTDASGKKEEPDFTTYAGEKAKSKEFGSRPKIVVRHEALGEKTKELFSKKKSPEGAKKPLLMFVLMGKKKPMSEETAYCPRCGTTHDIGQHPKSKFGPMKSLWPKPSEPKEGESPKDTCPTCQAREAEKGRGFRITKFELGKKPKDACEALDRTSLNLVKVD